MITGPTESKSNTHGAGYFQKDQNQLFQNGVRFLGDRSDYVNESKRLIRMDKDEEMVYIPMSLDFAGTLRAGPIRSLWVDRDQDHQHTIGLSIILDMDQAEVITKNLASEISGTSLDSSFRRDERTTSRAKFDFNTSFSGRARFEVVERSPTDSERGLVDDWRRDETYIGAMTISNKLQMETKLQSKSSDDGWLDCCGGGWNSMKLSEKRNFGMSADCVFNCTDNQSTRSE